MGKSRYTDEEPPGPSLPEFTRTSVITCPHCGYQKEETMPVDVCLVFYPCEQCGEVLRPLPGDCCVFCSFGSVPCPPVQRYGKESCC